MGKRKHTRREVFPAEMEQVVPWLALVAPHYPKLSRRGRQLYPLATMLRIHFLQQWSALSAPGMEEALYEMPVMRRFDHMDGLGTIPDETTILNFRRLLETHELVPRPLERVNARQARKGQSLKTDKLVDVTIIAAPSLTKNKDGERNPEMHQAWKGNQWFFRMKTHIGVDEGSERVHHVECTVVNVGDVMTQMHRLLRGKEDTITWCFRRSELEQWIDQNSSQHRPSKKDPR